MIIQERKTEGDSSIAKYSVLPVCFCVFLSPSPPLPRPPPPPLPLLHTHTLSICLLVRDWQREVREESTQYAAHSTSALF